MIHLKIGRHPQMDTFVGNLFTPDTFASNLITGPTVLFICGIIIAFLDEGELDEDPELPKENKSFNDNIIAIK